MSVSKKIMLFRQQRASELRQVAEILEQTIGGGIDTSPILAATKQLCDENFIPVLKDGTRNSDYWGYEIEDFKIPVETIKHIRPKGISKVDLTLNVKVIANHKEWQSMSDPLIDLNFNVVIRGIAKTNCSLGFHIDKHDASKQTTEPHPIYHMHYLVNPNKEESFDYGSVLYIDTPRIMHYPMDFILGIGFLTSNFYPTAFEHLLDNGTFTNIYKRYQESILKPFTHTLASHWPYVQNNIVWSPTSSLCPCMI